MPQPLTHTACPPIAQHGVLGPVDVCLHLTGCLCERYQRAVSGHAAPGRALFLYSMSQGCAPGALAPLSRPPTAGGTPPSGTPHAVTTRTPPKCAARNGGKKVCAFPRSWRCTELAGEPRATWARGGGQLGPQTRARAAHLAKCTPLVLTFDPACCASKVGRWVGWGFTSPKTAPQSALEFGRCNWYILHTPRPTDTTATGCSAGSRSPLSCGPA
jgi:hypothetical protein